MFIQRKQQQQFKKLLKHDLFHISFYVKNCKGEPFQEFPKLGLVSFFFFCTKQN